MGCIFRLFIWLSPSGGDPGALKKDDKRNKQGASLGMSFLNRVWLAGNLAKAPEMAYTAGGHAVCSVVLAINRRAGKSGVSEDRVEFFKIDFFGTDAEDVRRELGKGAGVFVEARLRTRVWTDKKTGTRRERLTMIGESFQKLF